MTSEERTSLWNLAESLRFARVNRVFLTDNTRERMLHEVELGLYRMVGDASSLDTGGGRW